MSVNNSQPGIETEKENHLTSHSPVYTGDTGHILLATHPLGQQPVPDLPGEHGGVLLLVFTDGVHDVGGGHLGLTAAYNSGFVVASFIVPAEHMEILIQTNSNPLLVVEFPDCLKDKKIKRKQKILDEIEILYLSDDNGLFVSQDANLTLRRYLEL